MQLTEEFKDITKKELQDKEGKNENSSYLSIEEQESFYKVFYSTLEYVNDKYGLVRGLKKTTFDEKQDNAWCEVIDYLFTHREVIDEFIEDNVYAFSEEELADVSSFKDAVTSSLLFIVGFEKDYTKVYLLDDKIYMIKGINFDLRNAIEGGGAAFRGSYYFTPISR